MKPKYAQLKEDIRFEINQLETVILKIKEIKDNPSQVNKAALGTYLMNFYNGIENIMKRCAKEYYKKAPKGEDWHKKLLQLSCAPNNKKAFLFNKDVVDKLYNYLTFRHLFIHGYGFKLEWDKMKSLVDGIDNLWLGIKNCTAEFVKKI